MPMLQNLIHSVFLLDVELAARKFISKQTTNSEASLKEYQRCREPCRMFWNTTKHISEQQNQKNLWKEKQSYRELNDSIILNFWRDLR